MRGQAPRFREAYPRFDVLRAVAEHRKGQPFASSKTHAKGQLGC